MVKIVFAATVFTIVLVDFLECCEAIPETIPCSTGRSFSWSVLIVAPISSIMVPPVSSTLVVPPVSGPIVILSGIVSRSVPKPVAIQGFVPDVVIVQIIELFRVWRGVCVSGVVAMPLSRGWLCVFKSVRGVRWVSGRVCLPEGVSEVWDKGGLLVG